MRLLTPGHSEKEQEEARALLKRLGVIDVNLTAAGGSLVFRQGKEQIAVKVSFP